MGDEQKQEKAKKIKYWGFKKKNNSLKKKNNSLNKKNNSLKNNFKYENINSKKKLFIILLSIMSLCIIMGGFFISTYVFNRNSEEVSTELSGKTVNNSKNESEETMANSVPVPTLTTEELEQLRLQKEKVIQDKKIAKLIEDANKLAAGYDYDAAISLLKRFEGGYTQHPALMNAIKGFESAKATLDPLGAYNSVDQINHIFFHSLIADNKLAFDGDRMSNGYNYYMTTISEFKEMMEQMYEDGYVLVSIHDVAQRVTSKDGSYQYVPGDIMLPPDKKPFVLSQDDVNYYEYMKLDGFASRIVIDQYGMPSTERVMEDGTVSIGEYDLIPILENFIAKHPDFSYRGARGIIALTGYEGTLGYRTNDISSPTYKKDLEDVKAVVQVLKNHGWEFASHSYGHRNMEAATYNFTVKDTNRWLKEVGTIVGPTDIYIYPFGIEVQKTLKHYNNDKYKFLKSKGFNYFCGVYKAPWIQVTDDYVRMNRRPLDGQAMLQFPERLSDLFDLKKVIDPDRPALKF